MRAAPSQAAEAELLLLELRVGRHLLASDLAAYQVGPRVFLPLGELARLLTIAIESHPAEGRAEGYVLKEDRRFRLDAGRGRVVLEGRESAFDPAQVLLQDDDIYVDSPLLSTWLPVDLRVDFLALALQAMPRETLPLQARLEREARGERLQRGSGPPDRGYPRQVAPYSLWDVPSIDLSMGTQAQVGSGPSSAQTDFSALVSGDLLGMESTLYLSRSSHGKTVSPASASDFRLTLGRSDPDGGLLGPMRARTFSFGSVGFQPVANIARASSTGHGVTISNVGPTQVFGTRTYTLQGDLPPGWDVELYANEALVGFQQSTAQGRYLFADVPLSHGVNRFRLSFHGPQGQTRIEEQVVFLDRSLAQPGELQYRLAAQEDAKDQQRFAAQLNYGLSPLATLSGSLTGLPLQGRQQWYGGLGARFNWGASFLTADLVHAGDGALAEFGLQTRRGRASLGYSHTRLFGGFVSEEFLPSADPVRLRDKFRLDGAWPLGASSLVPVSVEAKRELLQSGRSRLEAGARVSGSWQGVAVSKLLRWQSSADLAHFDGTLQFSSRRGLLGLRGLLGYKLGGEARLSTAGLSADRSLAPGWLLSGSVTRTLDGIQDTHYTAGLTKSIGDYGLRFNVAHSRLAGTRLGLQLLVSMARDPASGWHFDALPASETGGVSAKVFWDRNLNGVEDEGDLPVPGVAFSVNGGRHPARTDERGGAFLSRLSARQHVDIGIDPASIEDPQLTPRIPGLRIVPRPGKVQSLAFPLIATTEIDGSVHLLDGERKKGLGGLVLELVDAAGEVVSRARTAADGFYVIAAVPAGTYHLRIAKDRLQALGLSDTGRRILTVDPEVGFINGVDLDVIPRWEVEDPAVSRERLAARSP